MHTLSNVDDVDDSPVSAPPPLARSIRTDSTETSPPGDATIPASTKAETSAAQLDSLTAHAVEGADVVDGYESDDERPNKRHRPYQD
jgi:hypothetical protein